MNILILDEQYLLNQIERSRDTVLCRCCLSECKDGVCLFSEQPILDGMFSVDAAEILMSCFAVNVNKHDNLPKVLCRACLALAESTYILKKSCEKADRILKKSLPKNYEIIRTPSRILSKVRQESIENTPDSKISSNHIHRSEIRIDGSLVGKKKLNSSDFKRDLSVLNYVGNSLKSQTNEKSVRRKINMRRDTVDFTELQMKRSCSRNTDLLSGSVSRFRMGSRAAGMKREWPSQETLKSVNSQKMSGRGYKMLELALGRDMIVDDPKPRVKNEKRSETNYNENRIKSYLKDVWRSRHKKCSPYKKKQSGSSPLSGVSLCSFELMTPPKHYFYQNITDITNLGFTTPIKQVKKCIEEQYG